GQAFEYRKVALGHALVPVEAVVLGLLHRFEHGVEFRASQRCLANGDSGQVGVFGVEVVQEFGGDPFQGGGKLAARFQGDAQPLGQWFDVGVGGGSVVGAVPVDLHQPVGAAQQSGDLGAQLVALVVQLGAGLPAVVTAPVGGFFLDDVGLEEVVHHQDAAGVLQFVR